MFEVLSGPSMGTNENTCRKALGETLSSLIRLERVVS
jgi:hypothetical protein